MRRDRLWCLVLVGCSALAVMWVLYVRGPSGFPVCLFHRLTGLDCPGCGMTRGVHAALQGRFGEAFRFNPLGMLVLPVSAVWLAAITPAWLRGNPPPDRLRIGWRAACGLLVLLVGYWILRNLPLWPFHTPVVP